MKILYVSQYFPPEMGAPSARVSELAAEWAKNSGDRVSVLTAFAHHPLGVKAKGDRWRMSRRERHRGIDVVRSYVWATANRGRVRRMISYASFMISAVLVGLLRVRRPDVVIATSPQLLCACAGYVLAKIYGVPFVFEVRDLWPESILAVDALQENVIVRILRRVAAHLYRHAHLIVTVGDGYRRKIHELYGTALIKMVCIPNGIDPELFSPAPTDHEIRRQYGWEGRFVVMYVGTLGMAHGLETAVDAATDLRNHPEIIFVLVGEGARKQALQELAAARGLHNIHFVDQQPKERIVRFYSACDVGLVLLRDTPLFQSVLPSKIFEYLAMERPILLGIGGEARQVVEDSGAGLAITPEDAEGLATAVLRLATDPPQARLMGKKGRSFVVEHFNRITQARKYRHYLGAVVTKRAATKSPIGSRE